MRKCTLCTMFLVVLPNVLSMPDSIGQPQPNLRHAQDTLRYFDLTTRDYTSDLIEGFLGISASEFLISIDKSIKELQALINVGVSQLHRLTDKLDVEKQQQIKSLIDIALNDALTSLKPLLEDFGILIPSISTRVSTQRSVGEVIFALLGITFEDFLRDIVGVLEVSEALITRTHGELTLISHTISDPTVSNDLKSIANYCLNGGQAVIRPLLTSLYTILPRTANGDMGVFARLMSEAIGFNVVETGTKLDKTLEQTADVMSKFVLQINVILERAEPNVKNSVNKILKDAVHNVEKILAPILKVLLRFSSKATDTVHSDISSTILGVSLEDFLNYMDFAGKSIDNIYKESVGRIKTTSLIIRPHLRIQALALIDRATGEIEGIVEPLLNVISPILGERRWVSTEEYLEIDKNNIKENIFCNFSFKTGYNINFLLHLISKIFEFDVVEASEAMRTMFNEIDPFYGKAAADIEAVLLTAHSHPFVVEEVNRIFNISINRSHRAMQPVIDIFGEFIQNSGRHDKDIVNGIVQSTYNLNLEKFKNYMKHAARTLEGIASNTFANVHQIVQSGRTINSSTSSAELTRKIDAIMLKTLEVTNNLATPFLKLISPIFIP